MNEPGKFINILSDGGHQETKVVGEEKSVPNETDPLLDTRLQVLVDRHREVELKQKNTLLIKNPPSESNRILSNPPNISNPYARKKFDPFRKNGSKLNSDNEIDTLSNKATAATNNEAGVEAHIIEVV
uniref:Uncharacterized protein n=1 Tax=Acrobeloides nanus TaxID=290746 RepID=A0A914ECT4_9BILA